MSGSKQESKQAAVVPVSVVMVHQDDWNVNVLLSDGRFYSFVTEMWPEHGDQNSNWPPVLRRAKQDALFLAERNADIWHVETMPATPEQFREQINAVCMRVDDRTFDLFMRR